MVGFAKAETGHSKGPVGATGTKLDRAVSISPQVLATVRELLGELGAARGLEELGARGAEANLERELGLGSLERVELMLRLGDTCGVRLADRVVAEADTVQDLIDAIVHESLREDIEAQVPGESPRAAEAQTAPISTHARQQGDLERQIRAAESLTEILRLRGLGEPARGHIHLYEENEQVREITFGDLYQHASAVAAELQKRGLEPGQTVAIILPTCADFFYTFAGILLAGGIPVPLYPPFRADRIGEYAARQSNILRNAEVRFLVTFRQVETLARLLRPRVPSLREVLNAERLASAPVSAPRSSGEWRPVESLSHRARGEDIAFLQYTSGSTGDPKGVILTHANLLANIRSMIAGVELQPEDVAVSWLPLYHDMGLIGAWFVPLFSGIPLYVMSPLAFLSRPERWLWAIHRHRGTLSPAPNFAFELCVRKIAHKDIEGLDLSSWRAAYNGAEPVHADTLERFGNRFANYGLRREALLPVYGLAEATLGVSASRTGYTVDRIERETFESEGRAIPAGPGHASRLEFVGAGKPLPGVEVRIIGRDGKDVPERVEGRLWFRSPSATSGYYRNPAATLELVPEPGWIDSGDRAYLANGEIFITGRAKDVIIKGGRNLYPHEIEVIVAQVPGVRPGCVVAFGAPDERSGTEKLVIAAEVRNMADARRVTAEIIRTVDAAIGLPPDAVELLSPGSIPKTSSGKLRRSETRRLYLEGKLGKKVAPPWLQVARLAMGDAGPHAWSLLRQGTSGVIHLLYGSYALLVVGLLLIPVWLAIAVAPNRMWAARILHAGTRTMLFLAGIPVEVRGKNVLAQARKGACVYAPNHSSYLDLLVTAAVLPAGVRFVAKGEVRTMPFIGTIVKRTGQFAFDRSDSEARIEVAQEADEALMRGESVVIYPEGTFTATTGIRPFHLGAFKAAALTQKPICPVAVRGARQILRDGTNFPWPGRVIVTFGPILKPDPGAGDDWKEIVRLRDAAREIVALNSGEPLL